MPPKPKTVKKTESKLSKKESFKDQSVTALTWRDKLKELNINCYAAERSCRVYFLGESSIIYSEVTKAFHLEASENDNKFIRPITFSDVLNYCENYPKEDLCNFIEKQYFQEAFEEGKAHYDNNGTIPAELLAKMIKFLMLFFVNKDVLKEKTEKYKTTCNSDEFNKLFAHPTEISLEDKKANEKSVTGKKSKSTITKKKSKNKISKESSKEKSDESFMLLNKLNSIEIEKKEIYFILVNFFDINLLFELMDIDIPIFAFIEVAGKEDVLTKPTSTMNLKVATFSQILLDRITSNFSDEELVDKMKNDELNFHKKKKLDAELIYKFWNKFYEIQNGPLQYKSLEDTIHCKFIPPEIIYYDEEGEIKYRQKIFEDLSNFIEEINQFCQMHDVYINNLNLHTFEDKVKYYPVKKLKYYCNKTKNLPSECFNVYLYLDNLFQSVLKLRKTKTSEKNLTKTYIEIPEESYTLDFNSKEMESEIYNDNNSSSKYKNKILFSEEYNHVCVNTKKKNKLHRQKVKKTSAISFKYKQRPFVVHEKNYVEKIYRDFDYFSFLFQTTAKILQKHQVFQIWNKIQELSELEKLTYKHQIVTWSNKYNVKEELIDESIKHFLIDHIECTKPPKEFKFSGKYKQMFPLFNKQDQIVNSVVNFSQIEMDDQKKSSKLSYDYRWNETLSPSVLMQILLNEWKNFACADVLYSPYVDTILYHFHNNVDNFGIRLVDDILPLRTPVCIRDFTKFILQEENEWLDNFQEDESENLTVSNTSFQNRCLVPMPARDSHPTLTKVPEKFIKLRDRDTETFIKSLKSKGHSNLASELENQAEENENKRKNFISPKEKEENNFSFTAYDLGRNRFHYINSLTSFHSLDGITATINYSRWLGFNTNEKFSVEIKARNSQLFLYPNLNAQFMFHFYAYDGTIMLFAKPQAYEKEKETKFVKSQYFKQIRKNIPVKSSKGFNNYKATFDLYEMHRYKVVSYVVEKEKYYLPKLKTKEIYNYSEEHESCTVLKHESKENIQHRETNLNYYREIYKKIKKTLLKKKPIFKVCSSKVLGKKYLSLKKDYIQFEYNGEIIKVLFKPTFVTHEYSKSTKCYPINVPSDDLKSELGYEIKVTLPSSLSLDIDPYNFKNGILVKQSYKKNGLFCKSIEDEYYRVVLNNGTVIIRKLDGTVTIYCLNGTIIKYDIPFVIKGKCTSDRISKKKKKIRSPCKNIKRIRNHLIDGKRRCKRKNNVLSNLNPKDIYFSDNGELSLFPRYSILSPDGEKMQIFMGRVSQEKGVEVKKEIDNKSGEKYFEREDGTISMLLSDGTTLIEFPDKTRVKIWFEKEPGSEIEENQSISFEPSTISEYGLDDETNEYSMRKIIFSKCDNETFRWSESNNSLEDESYQCSDPYLKKAFRRFSGLDSLIDNMKLKNISSMFYENMRQSITNWSRVNMCYAVDHPNYASIVFDTTKENLSIFLPGNRSLNIDSSGQVKLTFDSYVSATVNSEQITIQSAICRSCLQKSYANLNIKHLYENDPVVPSGEILLNCRDTYNKEFLVDYEGKCFKNIIKSDQFKKEMCQRHLTIETEKIFTMQRDLTGCLFWNEKQFNNRMFTAKINGDNIKHFYDDTGTCAEFKSFKTVPFSQRYLMPFLNPKLCLTKYLSYDQNNQKQTKYISRRLIKYFFNYDKLLPVFENVIPSNANKLQMNLKETLKSDFVNRKIYTAHKEDLLRKNLNKMTKSKILEPKLDILEDFSDIKKLQEHWKECNYRGEYFEKVLQHNNQLMEIYVEVCEDEQKSDVLINMMKILSEKTVENICKDNWTNTSLPKLSANHTWLANYIKRKEKCIEFYKNARAMRELKRRANLKKKDSDEDEEKPVDCLYFKKCNDDCTTESTSNSSGSVSYDKESLENKRKCESKANTNSKSVNVSSKGDGKKNSKSSYTKSSYVSSRREPGTSSQSSEIKQGKTASSPF